MLTSLRVAAPTLGMGLLEAIPEADLLARADPDDRDGDGVSGRPNRVWDFARGATVMGRFGWKANQPTLRQQNAAAFVGDIGVTSPLFPVENCPSPQRACADAGETSVELDGARLDALTDFTRASSVPARRGVDAPAVRRGRHLFAALGCEACHAPSWRTRTDATPAPLAGQTVWPFTDLLLHDMGEGLADGRPDFAATGREWRTTPLWGLALQQTVSGHLRLLHDGRARGFAEAVLWHGGEAERASRGFRALTAVDRAALVVFLGSL